MPTTQIIQNVVNLLVIAGMVFSVYKTFAAPQQNTEKNDILLSARMNQLQADLINLRDNHVHTLDTKLDENNKNMQALSIQVTTLATIIDERIPKKNKNT